MAQKIDKNERTAAELDEYEEFKLKLKLDKEKLEAQEKLSKAKEDYNRVSKNNHTDGEFN